MPKEKDKKIKSKNIVKYNQLLNFVKLVTRLRFSLLSSIIILVSFLLILPHTAYAYLDLGSGSYFVQIIIATIVGVIFAVRYQFKRLSKLVFSLFRYFTSKWKK